MMLWYKAWLETRSRFLITLVGCTALSTMWVVEFGRQVVSARGPLGLFNLLHSVQNVLSAAWILSIVLLMMGGLLQEQAVGTSGFTLALPVSRSRMMWTRLGMGWIQAVLLAVTPWIGVLLACGTVGRAYPISQVLLHLSYLLCGGILSFAIAAFVSSIVEGHYTAPLASIGVLVLLMNAFKAESLQAYNPLTFMTGDQYFQTSTGLLDKGFHSFQGAGFLAATAIFLVSALKIIERRDF